MQSTSLGMPRGCAVRDTALRPQNTQDAFADVWRAHACSIMEEEDAKKDTPARCEEACELLSGATDEDLTDFKVVIAITTCSRLSVC